MKKMHRFHRLHRLKKFVKFQYNINLRNRWNLWVQKRLKFIDSLIIRFFTDIFVYYCEAYSYGKSKYCQGIERSKRIAS